MTTVISMLRGINVGQRKVLMADLKKLYEQSGFEDVSTYIQSGNVIFNTNRKLDRQLAAEIEKALFKKYGFDVPVINRTLEELTGIIASLPFAKKQKFNPAKLHVTFLSAIPSSSDIKIIQKLKFPPDKFVLSGSEVFLHIPGSYAETKLSNKFFESRFKLSATTRNWNTVLTLAELGANK